MDGENPVVLWGSGNQRRNYTHAHDCARIFRQLVERGYTGRPVNIGTTETLSIKELFSLICEVANVNPEVGLDLQKPEGRLVKSSDTTLLNSIVPHFEYQVSLREGICRMLDWYERTFKKGVPND